MKNSLSFFLIIVLAMSFGCSLDNSKDVKPELMVQADVSGTNSSISTARNGGKIDATIYNALSGDEVGTAYLSKNSSGFTINYKTTGLIQGHAYTLWVVVWNKPENCMTPNACFDGDFANAGEVEVEVMYVAGHVVGNSGKGNFSGRVNEGDDSGSSNDFFGLPGFGGLQDVDAAELHFVLRSHGPAIPGLINEQISSYEGGCTTFFPPFTAIPENPGECGDFEFAIFPPGC